MLAMTRRPSAITAGRVAKRPSMRTSSATAREAALPLPMAMPRSASLRASTSLTPSPVMATTWPRAPRASTISRFWRGTTRPNTERASSRSARAAWPSGRERASTGWSAPPMPTWAAMAPTVRGWSPETTLTWTPSAANQATVSAASPRTWSPITTMARGSSPAGGRSPSRGRAEWARSSTRRPSTAICSARRSRSRRPSRSTGASWTSSDGDERDPLPAGPLWGSPDSSVVTSPSRISGAPRRKAPWPEKLAPRRRRLGGPVRRLQPLHGQVAGRDRARLVEADHVHPGQGLDRRQLADQHLAAAEADHPDGEGDAGQQDQPLGDHGNGPGHGPAEPGPHPVLQAELADEQQRRRRHQGPGHVLEDLVDPGPQLGPGQGEAAGLLGELDRVGLPAHLGRLVAAAPG